MFSNQQQIIECVEHSLQIGRSHGFRVMLVLAGEANQCLNAINNSLKNSLAEDLTRPQMSLNAKSSSDYLVQHVPDLHSNSDVSDEINSLLGSEHTCVIFDARHKFEERLFAAAAGTITAGGLLVLQTPPFHEWATMQCHSSSVGLRSPFISRLCKKLAWHQSPGMNAPSTAIGQFKTQQDIPTDAAFFIAATKPKADLSRLSSEHAAQCCGWKNAQDSMLEALMNHLQSKEKCACVIQGDRGRGKSTLIGRAMRQLKAIDSSDQRSISITANRRSACVTLLEHAQKPIPFVPLDNALSAAHDILIVEEAGSIPIPVLEILLKQSQSIVFATTVQGYEGAGRGFAIRFAKRLDKLIPDWLKLNPVLPIRWSAGDPVEAFVNDALLLKTALPTIEKPSRLIPEDSQVSLIERRTLANNDSLLAQVYGLLVQAHYQTTPADLRNLLDQPELLLFAQKTDQVLTGAALVALEGAIPGDLHQAILHKQRRLPDQILPQLLAQSSGEKNVLKERFARIVRIAIHPDIHQKGFGTHMFRHLHKQLTTNTPNRVQVNSVGASFGADKHTLSFWLKQGLKPIHYGYKANPRSALRAACLVSSNHAAVRNSIDKACRILHLNTQAQLSQNDHNDPVQKILLTATMPTDGASLPSFDSHQLISDYFQSRRSFIDTVGLLSSYTQFNDTEAVHKVVNQTLDGYQTMSPKMRRVAEERLRTVLGENSVFGESN